MEPPPAAPAPPRPPTEPEADVGSFQGFGAGPETARASQRWPQSDCRGPPAAAQPPPPASENSADPDSDEDSEDGLGQRFRERGRDQEQHSDGGSSSDEASSVGEPSPELGGSAGCEKPAAAAEPVTKAMLVVRASKVFEPKAG